MLHEELTVIRGIGPAKARVLKDEAALETVEDLLYYIPRKYVDRSSFRMIKDCFMNETVTVAGTISSVKISGRSRKRLEVTIEDDTDSLEGVFFGGIEYFKKIFAEGEYVIFSGKVNFYRSKQMVHPDFDFIDGSSSLQAINTGRIVPLYRSTEKLKSLGFDSRGFRRIIKSALDQYLPTVEESLDLSLLDKFSLKGIRESLFSIHFPESFEEAESARRRLSFNEIFFHQYYLSLSRKYLRQHNVKKGISLNERLLENFISALPFALTPDQVSAINEIREDMVSPSPMNRLLQGDVGSGKTVVAMASVLMAAGLGKQSALMAPTEVLASQHFTSCTRLMGGDIRILYLTGSTPAQEKSEIYRRLAEGQADLVIGTHALIQEQVSFRDLGLIVIDEQHRFGVGQRSVLRNKGNSPDLLVMTATPIPRSLSLTLYGDLDISSIRTMPANRIPISTHAFPESRLPGVYNSLEKYLSQGRQVYYVLPLIEESEKIDLKSAIKVYEHLKSDVFPQRRVEILHGRMKQADKDAVMDGFKKGEVDILVSTTVIEVGIDVPNATVIVIEHAERFGLSQLHQLRGRVGRGHHQSFCVLVTPDTVPEESARRIETLVKINDGFAISEEDLKQRGAGELIGYRQHGHAGSFEFVDLLKDMDLIVAVREYADTEVSKLNDVGEILDSFKEKRYGPLLKGIRDKRILSLLS